MVATVQTASGTKRLSRLLEGESFGLCIVVGGEDGRREASFLISNVKCQRQLSTAIHTSYQCPIYSQDEAHHAPARSYQTVLRELGFLPNEEEEEDDSGQEMLQKPEKLLVGVTATAHR